MIIVQLQGGLGNQMFQYAAGRHLAMKRGVPLKLDLGFLQQRPENPSYTLREYELGAFNIAEEFATQEEVKAVTRKKLSFADRLNAKLFHKPIPYYRKRRIVEQAFNFDENIFRSLADCLLTGYWQSEKYFKKIESLLCKEFTINKNILPDNEYVAEMKKLIEASCSIGIHVRRSDYVSNAAARQVHGVCSPDYYYAAIDYVAKKVKNPLFFFFSDDMEWVRENLKIVPSYFVNSGNHIHDFQLMSSCKHNIIANSSYSWWAAWLNRNENKTVVAPKFWFKDKSLNTNDLISQLWKKM